MVDSRGLEPRKLARSVWFTARCNCRYTNHPRNSSHVATLMRRPASGNVQGFIIFSTVKPQSTAMSSQPSNRPARQSKSRSHSQKQFFQPSRSNFCLFDRLIILVHHHTRILALSGLPLEQALRSMAPTRFQSEEIGIMPLGALMTISPVLTFRKILSLATIIPHL